MRIAYQKTLPKTRDAMVLTCESRGRVELHLREDSDATCTLLAFSGGDETAPVKVIVQGPYEVLAQAIAARNAIVHELVRSGYQVREQALSIWTLHAQRRIRASRELKQLSNVDCQFDPKDVFLDW